MPTQTTKPTRPKLKQGETPQSPAFVKRMREFNRAMALFEATEAKREQDEREAKERASRDVLEEAKTQRGPKKDAPSKPSSSKKPSGSGSQKPGKGITGVARLDRARTIREAVEGGIQEADEEEKRKRRQK